MSHFTVTLVLGNSPKKKGTEYTPAINKTFDISDIEKAMQPFHEYECTGEKDEFVVFEDETEQMTKEYNGEEIENWDGGMEVKTIPCVYREKGENLELVGHKYNRGIPEIKEMYQRTDDRFSNEEFKLKEGHVLKDVVPCLIFDSVEEYARDWHDYDDENFHEGKIGRWTNPNAKWDWWQIGGRWAGAWKAKDPSMAMQGQKSWTNKGSKLTGFDIIQKKNIDIEAMIKDAVEVAEKHWESWLGLLAKGDIQFFKDIRLNLLIKNGLLVPFEKFEGTKDEYEKAQHEALLKDQRSGGNLINVAREIYKNQPLYSEMESLSKELELFLSSVEEFFCFGDYEKFIIKSKYNAVGSFAIIMDGEWHEKGQMGWFGMATNEDSSWEKRWFEIFDSIDDEAWLVNIDCHI